jgi:hypothetical protein
VELYLESAGQCGNAPSKAPMLFEAVLACLQAKLAGSYDALHCCPGGDGDITLANLEGQAMRCMLFMLLYSTVQ